MSVSLNSNAVTVAQGKPMITKHAEGRTYIMEEEPAHPAQNRAINGGCCTA